MFMNSACEMAESLSSEGRPSASELHRYFHSCSLFGILLNAFELPSKKRKGRAFYFRN